MATTYDLFTGFIESVPATWSGAYRMGDDNVQIGAVDAMKVFNLARVSLDRPVETAGERITALLDAINWTDRAIDTTETLVQAVTLDNTSVLSHIQDAAASEQGVFFVDVSGTATFFDRNHTISLDETNDVWDDADGAKHYASITTSYDESNLWNEVIVTANGLADQTASDTASQSLYYTRTLTVPTLLTTEADMLDRAEAILPKYTAPEFRVTSMTVDNASLDDTQWPRLLGREIHDRLIVRKHPAGGTIDQPSYVEGIQWDINPGLWRTTQNLSSTLPQVGQWELGTVGLSELGVTTTLVNTI